MLEVQYRQEEVEEGRLVNDYYIKNKKVA